MSMSETPAHTEGLGEQESIWFKLSALQRNSAHNPMSALLKLTKVRARAVVTAVS